MPLHLRESIKIAVRDLLLADELAAVDRLAAFLPPPDPFGLDHDCIDAQGHHPIRDRGTFVCSRCTKVLPWI